MHGLSLNAATMYVWCVKWAKAPPADGRFPKPLTQREEKELKRKNMKNLINLFIDDIKIENLNRHEIIRYGVIAPLVFYILILIEQIINAL